MNIERLTPKFIPGWDCRNGNCRSCAYLVSVGKRKDDHGIHGDSYVYGIRTELPDGRMAALTLEIFTSRYPATVNKASLPWFVTGHYPQGASLDLHLQVAAGASGRYDFMPVHEKCEWLGPGRRCDSDGSALQAGELYKAHGIRSDADGVDLMVQPDEMYAAMAHKLDAWTESR